MPYRRLTHASLDRMLFMHERIQRARIVNATTLREEFGVSPPTVWRDVAYMRDRLELPITFEPKRNSYIYTEPVAAFPTVTVSEGEVFSLLVASKAVEQYRGTPFHRQLKASFAKLTAGLKGKVSFSPSAEMDAVSFKSVGLGKSDVACFDALNRAVMRELEVEFDYRKPGERGESQRRVQPYHLSQRANLWYLVGQDLGRKALRTFAVPRIRNPVVTKVKFERPTDFSPEEYFANALGVRGGDGNYTVRVRFRGAAADRVAEREWHDSQKLERLSDGRLVLEMKLGALEEVEGWVLGWGAEAEVLAPPELRERVKRTIAEMGAVYGAG